MVPVRKPGRPLSSCPHPTSQPCSCGTVTAAIPRKQTCRCGSAADAAAEIKDEQDDSSTAPTPPSPSKAGASTAHRVQKAATKNGLRSRKQSLDPATFSRIDPSQLNIVPNPEDTQPKQAAAPNGHVPVMNPLYSFPGMAIPTGDAQMGNHPMMIPMFQHPVQHPVSPHLINPQGIQPLSNGHAVAGTNGTTSPGTTTNSGSCCGGSSEVQNQSSTQSTSTADSSPNGTSEAPAGSCCSTSPEVKQNKSAIGTIPRPDGANIPNGVMGPPFPPQLAMAQGIYPFYSHPTIFTYPAQYGSYMQPLQPEQWRQMMAGMAFAQPVQQFGMAPPVMYPGVATSEAGTTHQCSCGDGCQCVGCAAHPYNDATQNYVKSAWSTMMDDKSQTHTPVNGNSIHTNGNGIETPAISATQGTNGAKTPTTSAEDGVASPNAPQTPSDGASALSEEQTLSANDFFFVTYPFGDSCGGDTASCPCGDDCQCIGCVIHNNPGPEEITA